MITLAIVLARGNSKGIPRKNVTLIGGKPLIQYTIAAAREAASVDRIVVSTDSDEIAEVALAAGAEVPFRRPAELSGDAAPSIDGILHAVSWFEIAGYAPDAVVLLQPTSPFRTSTDIDDAVALMIDRGADSVVSVSPAIDHPLWTKTVRADGTLEEYVKGDTIPSRRQDLPPAYVLNGAIYLSSTVELIRTRSLCRPSSLAYVMPIERSIDIDTPWDLHIADLIMSNQNATIRY